MDLNFKWEVAKISVVVAIVCLLALVGTVNATNVTACGVYDANNTNYQLTANLTIPNNNQTCIAFTGSNNTINGMWNSVTGNESGWNASTYGFVGLSVAGQNNTIENFSVSGFGIAVNVGNTTNTLRFIQANTSGIGLYATYNGTLTSINLYNNTYGLYMAATAVNAVITNVNSYSSTSANATFLNNQTDGGYNYWFGCSSLGSPPTANCSWYNITRSSQEYSIADTYINYANPTVNYGTAPFTPQVSTMNLSTLHHLFNGSYAPGRITTLQNFTAVIRASGAAHNMSQYWITGDWGENTTTWNNQPAHTGEVAKLAASGTWSWQTFASAVNDTDFAIHGGAWIQINDTTTATWNQSLRENVTYIPYINATWMAGIGNNVTHIRYSNAGLQNTITAVSLSGATYCSVFVTGNQFVVPNATNTITGAAISTFYYAPTSSSIWHTFACSPNTFYTMDETLPYAGAINGTACPVGYTQVANVTLYNENATSSVITGNASVSATGTYTINGTTYNFSESYTINNTTNFTLCIFTGGVADVHFNMSYWNNTAPIRNYLLDADENTSTIIPVYLLDNSLTSAVSFRVKNQFYAGLPDVRLHLQRFIPTNASYLLVGMGTTDENGEYMANIYTNGTTFYRIYAFDSDNVTLLKTWSQEVVYCITGQSCTHDLIISEETTLPEYWTNYYGQVNYTCSFNNGTRTISCQFADGTGASHTFNLTAYRVSYGDPVQQCSQQVTAASGTLLCLLNDTNLTGRIYAWRMTRNSTEQLGPSGVIGTSGLAFKDTGPAITFLIIMIAAGIGLFNPGVSVLFAAVGLGLAAVMQLIHMDVAALTGIVIFSIIIAWRVYNSKVG